MPRKANPQGDRLNHPGGSFKVVTMNYPEYTPSILTVKDRLAPVQTEGGSVACGYTPFSGSPMCPVASLIAPPPVTLHEGAATANETYFIASFERVNGTHAPVVCFKAPSGARFRDLLKMARTELGKTTGCYEMVDLWEATPEQVDRFWLEGVAHCG